MPAQSVNWARAERETTVETQTNAPEEKWEDALKRVIGEERFGEARPNIRYEELMELLFGNHPEAMIDLSKRGV